MKKLLYPFVILTLVVPMMGYGQETETETIGKIIDRLTYGWDLESDEMDDYDGMLKFCTEEDYRFEIIAMLEDIHHYDSVLYDRLSRAARFSHNHEIKKTLDDIAKFEEDYSMNEFIHFLYLECQAINEIEQNRDDLEYEIGQESYDGKRYIIETELRKYIHHITRRVDVIREHVHHLHIE